MADLHLEYEINGPIEKVWQALVDPVLIEQWSGAGAKMDDQDGSYFELWNGEIHGKNIRLERNKDLQQEWFAGDWQEPSYVTIHLRADDHHVHVDLRHTNIPDEELEEIEDGWSKHYFIPLKELVEKPS